MGWFEFKLCPKASAEELVTQECLDKHLLTLGDGTTRFPVDKNIVGVMYQIPVQLPSDVICENCVLQWYYRGGNTFVFFIRMVFDIGIYLLFTYIVLKLYYISQNCAMKLDELEIAEMVHQIMDAALRKLTSTAQISPFESNQIINTYGCVK